MQKNLVIIGAVWPEPTSTAAGNRMLQIIDLFQEMAFSITFLSAAKKSAYSYDFTQKNIPTFDILLNDTSFDVLLQELNPTVVIFDRFMIEEQFGWRVIENCPDALRILDTEDLHFLRKARENAFKKNEVLKSEDLVNAVFKRELASIYRCDLSLIISKFEMELLSNSFKVDNSILLYLPFLVEPINEETYNLLPKFNERIDFVSIGNFLHEPNWQTVLQLKNYWKLIRKQLPKANLYIYGAYVSEKAMQLHNVREGFLIMGRAESVEKIYNNARVLLAPIPYGAGLKGKLLESMQLGLPSITTSIGAEGMNFNLDWNGSIADDENDFVEKAIELYENENIWNQKQKNGLDLVNLQFEKSLFATIFKNKICDLLNGLQQHRNGNFLGQIMTQNTLLSSKYMSKWIEIKNRS